MSNLTSTLSKLKKDAPLTLACRRRRIVATVVKTVLIEAAVWVVTILSMQGMGVPLYIVGVGLGILLPLLLGKPWKVFRRQYVGTVTEVKLLTRRVNRPGQAAGAKNAGSMVDAAFVELAVVEANGKRHRVELPSPYAVAYGVGDELAVLCGLSCPVNLTPREQIACPRCGALTPDGRETCITCGGRIKL